MHKSVNHGSDDDENQPEESGAQSGQLPGMAQDQDSVITPDVVARESRAEVMRDQGNAQEGRPAASNAGNLSYFKKSFPSCKHDFMNRRTQPPVA